MSERATTKVLIAIDDSDNSRLAVLAATKRSFTQPVSFKLLHIIEPFNPVEPSAAVPTQEWALFVERVRKTMKDDAYRILLEACEVLRQSFPQASIESQIIEGFVPAEIITRLAEEWQADIIFVGCRGRRGLERLLLGSVSHSVVLRAPCTVEVVRELASSQESDVEFKLENILIAIDDSEYSNAALDMFIQQDWGNEVNIKLVTVVKPPLELFGIELDKFLKDAMTEEGEQAHKAKNEWLENKARELGKRSKSKNISFELMTGDAREIILQASANWPAHLIVVGSHARSRLSRLILGSVSHALLLHSQCSIQVIQGEKSIQ